MIPSPTERRRQRRSEATDQPPALVVNDERATSGAGLEIQLGRRNPAVASSIHQITKNAVKMNAIVFQVRSLMYRCRRKPGAGVAEDARFATNGAPG